MLASESAPPQAEDANHGAGADSTRCSTRFWTIGATIIYAAAQTSGRAPADGPRREQGGSVIKLTRIGHVNLRVADQAVSKRFYRDVLGFAVAEEDPEHGGVFMTLGENFHTIDIFQHPSPNDAQRPLRGQIGLGHIAFQVGSYAALRDAYMHLMRSRVTVIRATNHVNQRSIYFADPDGNTLEIYYELPDALALFPGGRTDQDEALAVSGPDDPLPAWLLEDWPGPDMLERIERLRMTANLIRNREIG